MIKMCREIVLVTVNNIEKNMLFIMCTYILLENVIPEAELRNETRMFLHTITHSVVVGLEGRVRMELVAKKAEKDKLRSRWRGWTGRTGWRKTGDRGGMIWSWKQWSPTSTWDSWWCMTGRRTGS